jgi:hypothetical protein
VAPLPSGPLDVVGFRQGPHRMVVFPVEHGGPYTVLSRMREAKKVRGPLDPNGVPQVFLTHSFSLP